MANTYNFSTAFISYSRKNIEFVRKFADYLKALNLETWVDWDDIPKSVDWWKEIEAGIEAAHAFIFIISPESCQSDVCRNEIQHAIDNNKRIIPVLYREPTEDLHPAVGKYNWIIFDETQFEESMKQVLQTLGTDENYIRSHTRYLVRAREWLHRGRDDSFLLKGTDAHEAEVWLAVGADKQPPPLFLHREYIKASLEVGRTEETIQMQIQAVNRLLLRVLPAFLGGAVGMGWLVGSIFRSSNLFSSGRLVLVIASGTIFGLMIAMIVLFADELIRHRFKNRLTRFAVSGTAGLSIGYVAWWLFTYIFYSYVPDTGVMLLAGLGLSLGFTLKATFPLRGWQAVLITAVLVYLPLFIAHTMYYGTDLSGVSSSIESPLIFFDDPNQIYNKGIFLALMIAIGGHAHALFEDVKGFLNRSKVKVKLHAG